VSVLLPAFLILGGSSAFAWTFSLKLLDIQVPNDEDGDEPYFLVIGFNATFGVSGSTVVAWSGSSLERADKLQTPSAPISHPVHKADFGDCRLLNLLEITNRRILGALVIAMESDGSSWSDVENLAGIAQASLANAIDARVAEFDYRGMTSCNRPSATTDQHRIQGHWATNRNQIRTVGKELERTLIGTSPESMSESEDQDDWIGHCLCAFVASYDAEVEPGTLTYPLMHIDLLASSQQTVAFDQGENGSYVVTSELAW